MQTPKPFTPIHKNYAPKFDATTCPICAEQEQANKDAVMMHSEESQVIWCAGGHVTILIQKKGKRLSLDLISNEVVIQL